MAAGEMHGLLGSSGVGMCLGWMGCFCLCIVDGENAVKGANMYQNVGISSLDWVLVGMELRGKHS